MEFLKAWGRGFLALYLLAFCYAAGGLMLWSVGTGEVTGWVAVLFAPLGCLALLMGIGLTALFGNDLRDADEKYRR